MRQILQLETVETGRELLSFLIFFLTSNSDEKANLKKLWSENDSAYQTNTRD